MRFAGNCSRDRGSRALDAWALAGRLSYERRTLGISLARQDSQYVREKGNELLSGAADGSRSNVSPLHTPVPAGKTLSPASGPGAISVNTAHDFGLSFDDFSR